MTVRSEIAQGDSEELARRLLAGPPARAAALRARPHRGAAPRFGRGRPGANLDEMKQRLTEILPRAPHFTAQWLGSHGRRLPKGAHHDSATGRYVEKPSSMPRPSRPGMGFDDVTPFSILPVTDTASSSRSGLGGRRRSIAPLCVVMSTEPL